MATQAPSDVKSAPVPADLAPQAGEAPRRKGSRTLLNFWLDVTMFVLILFILWVSLMLQVVFPAPTAADGWTLWGLSFDQWRDLQFYAFCLIGLLALEHVVLHWNWVCSVLVMRILRIKSKPDEGTQAVYGVGTFIILQLVILGSILLAMFTVKPPG